ncbi:MAG: DUF6493 family protein [Pseudomonadota bacterium]|nr:DUF6493 family protein [Pseudomonadota bacterium]
MKTFLPDTPLEHAIRAGDYEATLAVLRNASAAERQASRSSVRRVAKLLDAARWATKDPHHAGWGMPVSDAQMRAADAALIVCGSTSDVAGSAAKIDDLIALGLEFKPDSLQGLAEAELAVSPHRIAKVQRLIEAGLAPRPESDEYAMGLMCLGRRFDQAFASDPGMADVLLRIMEVEGTSDCNLASIDKYNAPKDSWSTILRALCARGIYSRETLLDRTLSAFERDWPQFRSGWFSRFHGELAPELALMVPHARRYLGLCHSRIPPTVSLALDALKRLDDAGLVEDAALIDALHPVLASSAKGQVDAALKLLDKRVKHNPAVATAAAGMTALVLVHESADLQAKALQRIARWGVDDALRARLTEFLPGIAAVNRPALEALLGIAPGLAVTPMAETPAVQPMPLRRERMSPLDASRRLLPPVGANALVACIAHTFENDADVDSFEMACLALVHAAPLSAAEREGLGPVIKRAAKVRKPLAQELARLLLSRPKDAKRCRKRSWDR